MISKDTTVKKLRQKVTSKLRASSRCRVTTPAMDHKAVQPTMVQTAKPCVMRMVVNRSLVALAVAFFQVTLAQTHALRRDFNQLIVFNEFDTIFKREVDGRRDLDRVFFA